MLNVVCFFLHPVLLLGSNGASKGIEWNWKHLLEEFRKFGYENFFFFLPLSLSCYCCYCCCSAAAADRLHTYTTITIIICSFFISSCHHEFASCWYGWAEIHRIVNMKRGRDFQRKRKGGCVCVRTCMANEIFCWFLSLLLRFVINFIGNICTFFLVPVHVTKWFWLT